MTDSVHSAEELRGFIQALESALARGVLRTTVNGETVEFENETGLRRRISYFRGELNKVTTGAPRGGLTVTYPTTSRGL